MQEGREINAGSEPQGRGRFSVGDDLDVGVFGESLIFLQAGRIVDRKGPDAGRLRVARRTSPLVRQPFDGLF